MTARGCDYPTASAMPYKITIKLSTPFQESLPLLRRISQQASKYPYKYVHEWPGKYIYEFADSKGVGEFVSYCKAEDLQAFYEFTAIAKDED
jgi:hypothetical protein